MDTLQRFDEILNKIPVTLTSAPKHNNRVTFDTTTKPPQEQQPAAPRVANNTPISSEIDEPSPPRVVSAIPTPRVSKTRQTKAKATIDKPILTKERMKTVDGQD
jgi:hypothetical protein